MTPLTIAFAATSATGSGLATGPSATGYALASAVIALIMLVLVGVIAAARGTRRSLDRAAHRPR